MLTQRMPAVGLPGEPERVQGLGDLGSWFNWRKTEMCK